ncbi:MAG: tRNA (adenosine(37)-N6)-threonylcarbamoyltransferase complex ATPase subunit type 1 TsaE [Acutalibacteraceae bacterium]
MPKYITNTPQETEDLGAKLSSHLKAGDVVALYGGLGMGKTAFVRGMAAGLGLDCTQVSSPTFALVNDYGGNPPLVHFDMYRINSWEDLYSTGFFDYLDAGAVLAVEWSENIENALPEQAIRVTFSRISDNQRQIDMNPTL